MANARMRTGATLSDECKLKFMELKSEKAFQYIVFKLHIMAQHITVEKFGGPDATYEEFTSALPANDCRYAVYDFEFTTDDNCQKSKIFFITWWLDFCPMNRRLPYASAKEGLRPELHVDVEYQATDYDEMDIEVIKDLANKKR